MQLVHEPATGDRRTIASTVDVADSIPSQARGLMFRRSIPDDYALAFRFDSAKTRDVHMLFVTFPIDVIWVTAGRVGRVERLRPWIGFARAEADLIVELPAGAAADVDPGDRIAIEDDDR